MLHLLTGRLADSTDIHITDVGIVNVPCFAEVSNSEGFFTIINTVESCGAVVFILANIPSQCDAISSPDHGQCSFLRCFLLVVGQRQCCIDVACTQLPGKLRIIGINVKGTQGGQQPVLAILIGEARTSLGRHDQRCNTRHVGSRL